MAIRPILLYPDPHLKTVCDNVTDFSAAVGIVQDLLDTIESCPPRTVGIAAPQIGVLRRVAIVDTSRNPKYPEGHGLLALVNPAIVESDGAFTFREGCLSLPEYTANIRRSERVAVQAFDPSGKPLLVTATGFEAVVLQHEIDHLNGLLFLDRVTDLKTDIFRRRSGSDRKV